MDVSNDIKKSTSFGWYYYSVSRHPVFSSPLGFSKQTILKDIVLVSKICYQIQEMASWTQMTHKISYKCLKNQDLLNKCLISHIHLRIFKPELMHLKKTYT